MIDYENKKEKLRLLQKEQSKLTQKMREEKLKYQNRVTTDYEEMKKRLFDVDMQIIELKESLRKEEKENEI